MWSGTGSTTVNMTTSITADPIAVTHAARPVVHRRVQDLPLLLVVQGTAIVSGLMFWAVHYSLVDDAYITMAYAKQLAYHGNWAMVPDYSANSATSPLN